MADLVIRGGTVIDADGERRADVVVDDGRIVAVGADLEASTVLDAGGCIVAPGLVDLAARLGEPGDEQAETIETATRAAVLGGFTTVVALPDTDPVVDTAAVVREIRALAAGALCRVEIAAALTMGRAGERLAPIGELVDLGVRLFTDGSRPIADARLMRRAMEYVGELGATIMQRPEDPALAAGGHMHEGAVSSLLGMPGIPAEAEEIMVMRDIALSRLTGCPVHFMHLSAAGSIAIVRAARAGGLGVTASVTPHHLALTDEAVRAFDPHHKVTPPLRTADDRAALRAGVVEGVIDAIATDHRPCEPHHKDAPFDEAPAGVSGLQTAFAAALTHTDLPIARLLAAMSWQPAAIAGIGDTHGGSVAAGRPADLTVIDPTATWVVQGATMASRSRNTAFEGTTLRGLVRHTIVHGEPVVVDGEAQR